ncbi:MAG TPA: D-glycero-beta-D-manno-heptose-7-phosphate kinase [Stellaceae bacterium]|nr:D-glycero-beta-D-manno-heptose-7-phosphate kinase [Stellaceae bacterium]
MDGRDVVRELVDRLPGARVAVLGDPMLDRYVYGSVDRISPEAPIPIIRANREMAVVGGAGNVVVNLTTLGASAVFLTVLGDDAAGSEIADLVRAHPRTTLHAVIEPGRRSTVKTRYVAGSHQLLRVDYEVILSIDAASEAELLRRLATALGEIDVIVCSDYGKGVVTPTLMQGVAALAKAAGKPVIVDPKGTDYSKYAGVTLITPNRAELREATRSPIGTSAEIAAAASGMLRRHNIAAALVTRSEDGMTLVMGNADGDPSAEVPPALHIEASAREVFDVSGAGDTVIAVVAAAYAAGADLADAARLANVAAGLVVGKVGTAAVHPSELKRALMDDARHTAADKILGVEEIAERVEAWRDAGLSVGFTNGCFDLLHPGHVSLLSQSRRACDRLVVGLNTDASVSRLKGPDRPIQRELARATVLASLADVDAVVLFDDETPFALIDKLRPDVLIKGADYTPEGVVGADLVRSYGGRLLLAELIPEQSTSRLVQRSQPPPVAKAP